MLPSEGSLGLNPPHGADDVGTRLSRFVLSPSRPQIGVSRTMAPRANWKGFLASVPSDVSCRAVIQRPRSPMKISFNQLNRQTGHRIKYAKVDADTGEEVANEDIVKGYKIGPPTRFVEVTKEELRGGRA